MDEEEERIRYEEEEVTTIHRKTIRTQSRTKLKKKKDSNSGSIKTEIILNPHIHGAKLRDAYQPKCPDSFRKSDHVQKLVRDTLNGYQCSELPQMNNNNRVFLGAMDSDGDDEADNVLTGISDSLRKKTKRKGIDRFRRIVDFVILAQNMFTVRKSVHLNRRDSILFFLDRQGTMDADSANSEPKFDVNAFKAIGQKTKMASVKSFLDIPQSQRTDGQINHMMHSLRAFNKFSNYPNAVQTGLCKRGWHARFEASKVIVKEGNKADFYYLILSGIAVYRDVDMDNNDEDGTKNKQIATYLNPGDTIGEKEILMNTDRPATIVCKEPVEVLGVDSDTLLDIFKASGGLGSLEFLKSIPELSDFPLELLQTYHFSMVIHHYRRGAVIAKNSNESEWIYIVRTGSCQVYKAIKDHLRKEKHHQPQSRPVSSNKMKQKENGGLVLPNIKSHKRDNLKSASNIEINGLSDKKSIKKKKPSLERSQTMLPTLNPDLFYECCNLNICQFSSKCEEVAGSLWNGKTSLVQCPQNKDKLESNIHHSKKKLSLESVDSTKSKHLPDIMRVTHNDSIKCETPDSVRKTRRSHVQSPAKEHDKTKRQRRKSTSVSVGNDVQSRKQSVDSDPEIPKHDSDMTDSESPRDTNGSMFYVRLGNVPTKGVFGLHPLVYDDMPNLSLVSNGAECVLISKQFLKDNMTSIIAHRLRNKLPPYPSSCQLRNALDDQINWDNYREQVVNNVMK